MYVLLIMIDHYNNIIIIAISIVSKWACDDLLVVLKFMLCIIIILCVSSSMVSAKTEWADHRSMHFIDIFGFFILALISISSGFFYIGINNYYCTYGAGSIL